MQDLTFDSSDLGETEEFLVQAYTKMRIGGAGEQSRARISRRALGAIGMDELAFTYDMSFDADPLSRIVLCEMRSGHIEETISGRQTDVFAPGDLTLFSPPGQPHSGTVRGASYALTVFDTAILDRVAASVPGARQSRVVLTGHRTVSRAAGRRLGALIDYLRGHVLPDQEARASELVIGSAVTHLAAATLNAFPHNASIDPTAVDRRDAGVPALLRRAVAFIEENVDRDIALADIAGAVYLTPRAVQYMFRRHLDCTPTEYLRRVRLHRAHYDLLTSSPQETTVSAIAKRWGFAHNGRFAAFYRQNYGRPPAVTLRS
ncbi:MAG: helix-turn-helix transcriptional regulator [Mycolicibacterium neoaurum]|uniref:AraC family transcriptional regulator n=1 Tax=Mycolicibacterium neoaurum TaxID=1795 RepID=UPI002FF49DDF